jgi:hypothetical protein
MKHQLSIWALSSWKANYTWIQSNLKQLKIGHDPKPLKISRNFLASVTSTDDSSRTTPNSHGHSLILQGKANHSYGQTVMSTPLQDYNTLSHRPQSSSYRTTPVSLRSILMLVIMLQALSLNKTMLLDARTWLPSTQNYYNWLNVTTKSMIRNYLPLSMLYATSATIYKATNTPQGFFLTT